MTIDPTTAASDRARTPNTVEVVRSEEQLRVGTVARVRERVRLHKRVVTEEVTRTATVSREILDIERLAVEADQPLGPVADRAHGDEIEIILHEERVVITTVVVPVERVRVRIDRITEQVDVAEVVRREQIEVVSLDPTGSPQRTS